MTWQSKFGYAVFIMLIWLSVATAATVVNEDGDAGNLPNNAQIVDQEVDLSDGIVEIHGSIIPGNDEDMYRINVSLPLEFSVNTNLPGIFIEDTRLFVFNENGEGVCANHDNPNAAPGDPSASLAVLPAGSCRLEPGVYYVAISTFQRYPVFLAGNPVSRIFPDMPRNAVVRPVTSRPVVDWQGIGQQGDEYIIELTGINYPAPEDCRVVGETINGQTKTVEYLARDLNLGIASVDVGLLNLVVDQDESAPLPEVHVPLDTDNEAVLQAGQSLSISPPRNEVTINVVNPNRFVDLNGELTVTNSIGSTRVCKLDIQRDREPNPPLCSGPQVIAGEPRPTLEEVVQDPESGIRQIEVDFLKNATLTIDGRPAGYAGPSPDNPSVIIENPLTFDPPTTREITIRAVKQDETKRATVVVLIYDNNDNVSRCDPHVIHLVMSAGQFLLRESVSGLRAVDHYVTLQNGDPGTTLVAVQANEGYLHTNRLDDLEEARVNTQLDMVEGNNTTELTAIGTPGSSVIVVIADQPSTKSVVTIPRQTAITSNIFNSQSLKLFNHNWSSK